MEERLQKILAHAGVASRRECEKLISAGAVVVNGECVSDVGIKFDPEKCTIKVHGKMIDCSPRKRHFQYLIVHKPRGVLTTMKEDLEGRPTLLNLLNAKVLKHRLYPVGRLDFNSEGLLLLTNDGEMAHRMTHPKFKVPKTYEVKVHGIPPRRILDFLAQGVNLEDGRTRPAKVKLLRVTGKNAWLLMTINEGKKRQIRRMCEKMRYPVTKLRRVKIGPLLLRDLEIGKFRYLADREIQTLREAVDLA
ncbi:pseudouridine synthase [candidate division KSB3 bacterium]|uniref:Pseudouridine synthase n=1 Tax=candidate division KSB3 bacterium TaxID=2044937 RepID=A0A2G6E0Z9_9BACT|nr:MAG: pseudouridine synthase [candidate division KSB3 bacterium]PIE30318.1 MAG: pseudouridine synthase [candidate division KSB3 bacterium]